MQPYLSFKICCQIDLTLLPQDILHLEYCEWLVIGLHYKQRPHIWHTSWSSELALIKNLPADTCSPLISGFIVQKVSSFIKRKTHIYPLKAKPSPLSPRPHTRHHVVHDAAPSQWLAGGPGYNVRGGPCCDHPLWSRLGPHMHGHGWNAISSSRKGKELCYGIPCGYQQGARLQQDVRAVRPVHVHVLLPQQAHHDRSGHW